MTCPRCRQDTRPGARLCPKCGASLRPSARRQRPAGLDPNLNAIAKTAARLCDAHDAQIYLADSATLRLVAQHGSLRTTRHLGEPFPVSRSDVHGRAVLERRVIHVRDMKAAVRTQYPGLKPRQRATGIRTMLAAPLLSEGAAIGVIVIRRLRVRSFTTKQVALLEAFAEHAATAIENTRLAQVQAEALEQQTATSEILGVISSSPTDVQPVFNAIAENAARLCDAAFDTVNRFDGELTTLAAHYGVSPETLEVLQTRVFPFRPTRENASGRALLDRAPVHVHDIQSDPEYSSVVQALEGYRTVLSVPMLREGTPIGTITLWRREMRPFSDKQIEMVKTFADQAVIAIENVRLFRDLTEALEQQTATSEILRVISSSPTTLDPVLDAVVKTAARLCDATNASLYRVEGDFMRKVAGHGSVPTSMKVGDTQPVTRGRVSGRAMLERRTLHFPDLLAEVDTLAPEARDNVRREGVRTFVATPLLREGVPIGAISVYRAEVRPFSDKQIALLKTFADQAVIAIENVRLFKELEARNRDLTVALDRQTATSEILRVIGSSPTDAEPVFDAIVRSAVRLLGGFSGAVLRLAGDDLQLAAITSTSDSGDEAVRKRYPRPLADAPIQGQAIRERAPSVVSDIEVDPRANGEIRRVARVRGYRSMLQVPMLREDTPIGVISVTRREPGPFAAEEIALLQTFADQAVIAIENVRLFKELEARNRDLTESLGRETATSEILRVISRSPGDMQPVFDAIVRTAVHLCNGLTSAAFLYDGDLIHNVALSDASPDEREEFARQYPMRPDPERGIGRVVLSGAIAHSADVLSDPNFREGARRTARLRGHRALLIVPMLRDGRVIGAISVGRAEPGLFTDSQVQLLQTFADQAVIAIENSRLFRDLTDALEQQTATAEILRAISSSPTDIRPVLETLVHAAARFCSAENVALLNLDGDVLRGAAAAGPFGEELIRSYGSIEAFEVPLNRGSVTGRSVLERRTVHLHDLAAEPESELPVGLELQRRLGHRTLVSTPLLREGMPIGAILLFRTEVKPFTDKQLELLRTFADQAVIAIENVRLFKELQSRNAELTQSLERQTATAEILSVISRSPTDLQPVLEAVARNASRLCSAANVSLYRVEGDLLRKVAEHEYGPQLTRLRVGETRPITRGSISGRAVIDGTTIHVRDQQSPEVAVEFPEGSRRDTGIRGTVGIPLLREGAAIGSFTVYRTELRPFSEDEITLLQTFADQAVIAIENVRLFKELEARNRDLTEALEQQTATGEILRVISSSPTDIQPVLDTLVESAGRLCQVHDVSIFRVDGDVLRAAAHQGPIPQKSVVDHVPVIRGTTGGRSVLDRKTIHIADLQAETDEFPEGSAFARRLGHRTILTVPLLREGKAIGVINLRRAEVLPFTDKQIKLLQTFADQAVIAIENVRLFKELEARNRDLTEALDQQTATSEILRVISSSPTSVEAVFDTILASALRLCETPTGGIFTFDGRAFHLAAAAHWSDEFLAALREAVILPGPETPLRRVGLNLEMSHVADIFSDPAFSPPETYRLEGMRTSLAVPMLKEGRLVGALTFHRREVRPFTEAQIALIKIFADQAVIAIENVRLFKELEARNRDLTNALEQQTATSDVLRIIAQSPTELQPVLDAIATSAVRLCGASDVVIERLEDDHFYNAAHAGTQMKGLVGLPLPLTRRFPGGRAVLDRRPIIIDDIMLIAESEYPDTLELLKLNTVHSCAEIPLLSEGKSLGNLAVLRAEVRPFTEAEVALLQTFADQAVIAIENVRLFKELEARNRDLSVALEQQTATSEILRVISQSQTDVQPVFDAIVQSAVRLCDGLLGGLYRFDGELIHQVAQHNYTPEGLDEVRRTFPMRPSRALVVARAILERAVFHLPDVDLDPDYRPAIAHAVGARSILCVPMLRDGAPVGAIAVGRAEVGPFSDKQIELLKTFADQAVIAIENVRLFKELQARTQELTQSVELLTALGEVSRAVSSTLDVETVLDMIVSRASQLASADGCMIYEYDEGTEQFHVRATHNLEAAFEEAIRRVPIGKGQGVAGRAAELREPLQVADITQPGAYESSIRDLVIQAGYRSALAVPLLREDEVIGSLTLTRKTPGEFSPEIVETLKTFATQSALAIQNARLFKEIEDKGRQLEVASRHKSQFLANMSHELRTPLNAILGYTELLQDGIYGQIPEKAQETMQRVDRSGRHLLALINDVLDLSKIEAGQLTLSLGDYSLKEVVQTVVTALEPLAAEKKLALRVTVAPDLPVGRGDDRRLSQVLLNLVGNAVKFTDAGEVRVAARVSDGAFLVSVSDTGPGIAAEDQARIFEEFQQADTSNTRKKGGTGLGLSIAKRIIGLHGGELRVESAPGKGSTFSFTVPVRVERMAEAP